MFIIEPAQAKHIAGLHRAFDIIAREQLYFSTSEAMPLAEFTEWMEQNLQRNLPQFVAISTEGVIGWCIVHVADQPFLAHSGCLFMGLLPRWRGRGIGTQLLAATLDKSRRSGLVRVYLDVYADNEPAIRLYNSFGFIGEGLRRRAHVRDGVYRDVLGMALLAECEEDREMEASKASCAA